MSLGIVWNQAKKLFTTQKAEIKIDPINKFPSELLYMIFSFLSEKDQIQATRVSKAWRDYLDEGIYKPRCLNASKDGISWKMHYFKLEAFNRRVCSENPQPTVLTTVFSPRARTMFCDTHHGVVCFAYNTSETMNIDPSYPNNTKAGDYKFEIWDLKTDKLLKKINCLAKEWVKQMAFGYPFLLTRTGYEILIRDVSLTDDKPPIGIKEPKRIENISINQYGWVYTLEPRCGDNTHLLFCHIKENALNVIDLDDYKYDSPISLLHDNLLIYTESPGNLRVRDVSKEGLPIVIESLCTSEVQKNSKQFETMERKEIAEILKKENVTSMIAHDKCLIGQSENNLMIWSLESGALLREFPQMRNFKLDAFSGHTLFMHSYETIIVLDISGKTPVCHKEWKDRNDPDALTPLCYYQEKLYILDRKKTERQSSLTRYDYSKKIAK